jgi:hypothetical protein
VTVTPLDARLPTARYWGYTGKEGDPENED